MMELYIKVHRNLINNTNIVFILLKMELYYNIIKEMNEENKIKKCNFDPNKCRNCGGTDLEQENYGRVCFDCAAVDETYKVLIFENQQNYSSRKYTYNRTDYFQKCVEEYQGKQNCNVSEELLEKIRVNIKGEITRTRILLLLKEFKFTKHYKNVHRIFTDLTGELFDDIEYLHDDLLSDYKKFKNMYYTLNMRRKNFLNVQYILYHLLKRRGHPCNAENFILPKTEKSRVFHEEVCQMVFNKLGW